ncbi:DNA-processing protein DprA [Nocardia wallacei]|uniref:DNA-processing protein DprA n=1 Tax=Nocardia wallacei TaxID=480035 RepID=UPI002458389C|nr:DNA-processing protein DprA [Nocardia wallacei]
MGLESTLRALVAFEHYKTPSKVTRALLDPNSETLRSVWKSMDVATRDKLVRQSEDLANRDIYTICADDARFPKSLVVKGRPIVPALFCRGKLSLLKTAGAGMCGSRNVSSLGIKAARACGEEVSDRGLTVVSGYAKGVDTETHLAALERGGRTIIVLAEGINHFRVKRDFVNAIDFDRVLVISQFHPQQPWAAHAAMARNHLIFGLGLALVVIEAGERGGTLAAGRDALKRGRPVFVLNFGGDTPPGNRILLDDGGHSVTSRKELGVALDELKEQPEQGLLV